MAAFVDGLLFAWHKNQDYGPKLVADLSEEQMVAQPTASGAGTLNHPAWLLSHLNLYLPVMVAIIEGRPFEDPKIHRYGMQSQPMADRAEYPSKAELVETFVRGHEAVEAALRAGGDAALATPVELPRWKPLMPTAGIALPYLMLNHENVHLGQLSAWRRSLGLPSV